MTETDSPDDSYTSSSEHLRTYDAPSEYSPCPCYSEQRNKEDWRKLYSEVGTQEPKCGHAIDYLVYSRPMLADSTLYVQSGVLRRIISFLHARDVIILEAKTRDFRDLLATLAQNGRRESTISQYRKMLGKLYRHINNHRDEESPFTRSYLLRELDPSKFDTRSRIQRRPLTKEEISRLLEEASSFQNRMLYRIGIEVGPRSGDLSRLKLDSINLDDNTIFLPNTKSDRHYRNPLPEDLSVLLRHWIEVEREARLGYSDNPYLFPDGEGSHIDPDTIRQNLQSDAEKAGIQEVIAEINMDIPGWDGRTSSKTRNFYKVDVHTLRHTFNRLMKLQGISREVRSFALDHKSTTTTKEYYENDDEMYRKSLRQNYSGISGL